MTDVSHVRVSDAERNGVIERLQNATAEGRLSLDELDERIAGALSARTWSDLDQLVDDLPAHAAPEPRPTAPGDDFEDNVAAPPLAQVGALLAPGLGAVAILLSFGSTAGPALGLATAVLGALALLAPGTLARPMRWAAVAGILLGLLPAAFYVQLVMVFIF